MNTAVIVAGGTGQRLAADRPKQFLTVGGRELLGYSIDRFQQHSVIHHVVLVCHRDWLDHCRSLYSEIILTEGGTTRQDSVRAGLKACPHGTRNVFIHDAARPFVSNRIISECCAALNDWDAAVPAMPPVNSLIQIQNDQPAFLDRAGIRAVQTPQCFRYELICEILRKNYQGSDELGVALREIPDLKCRLIDGSDQNFKITTDLDLKLAKLIAADWKP